MSSTGLTWSIGPADSRLVRVLLYLAEGLFGGIILSSVLLLVGSPVIDLLRGVNPWSLGLVAVLLFLLVWKTAILAGVLRAAPEPPQTTREWVEIQQWRWAIVTSLIVTAFLVGGEVFVWEWYSQTYDWISLAFFFAGIALFSVAGVLVSTGEIDRDTMTLTDVPPSSNEPRRINLRSLRGVKRFTIGDRTLLWLSFEPGYGSSTKHLHAIPTEVVDRGWSVFQSGLAADVEVEASARSARRQNLLAVVGFTAITGTTLATFSWLGAPSEVVVVLAMVFAFVGIAFLYSVVSTA